MKRLMLKAEQALYQVEDQEAARKEFAERKKQDGETREQFERAIQLLAARCNFGVSTKIIVSSRVCYEFHEEIPPTSSQSEEPVSVKAKPSRSPYRGHASTASQMGLVRYKKTGGAVDGESFVCKMLTLVFLRMLAACHEFQLASNMEAAGLFDDIVLRHRKDPDTNWDVSYVQLKHKQNKTGLISKPDLLDITGDFSLVKYCASYEAMKSSQNLLSFDNFVDHEIAIFTNASIEDQLVDVLESDPLLSTGGTVVSFKAGGTVYQELCEWVDFKEALTELLGQVDGEEVEIKFMDALKGVKYDNKAVTCWRDELLKSPTSEKLKELLEKLAPVSDKATYSSFLSKLQVYRNQAHESQLDSKIEEQLARVWFCDNNLEAAVMLITLQSQVKSWWQKDNVYLTQDSPLWLGLVNTQTELISKSSIDPLTKCGVEFVDSCLRDLHEKLDCVSGILNLRVDSTTAASSLKVHQALVQFGTLKNVLHVNLQAILHRLDEVLAAWSTRWCRVLVLECDQQLELAEAQRLASRIINFFDSKNGNKLLVLIASKKYVLNDLLHLCSSLYTSFMDNIVWGDMTEKAKEVILSIKISINGSPVNLSDVVRGGECFGKMANLDVISQFFQEDVCFGKDLDEVNKFFVTRRLQGSANDVPFVVNSVSDVRRKVVLVVAEQGMGKSSLITHLAKSAKAEDGGRRWIVHITLRECSQSLKEINVEHFNSVTAWKFLEQCALRTGTSLEKLIFRVLEDKLIVFIDGVDEVCPHYEKQIFTLLRFLKELKLHQLWVASRTVFQSKLERTLGVETFHLVAFSDEDLTQLYNKIWKSNIPSVTSEKRNEVTATLLSWLTDSLGKDNPILGVPLMTVMIAEIFQDRVFPKGGANRKFNTNERLDVMSLYKTFLETMCLRYSVEKQMTTRRELAINMADEAYLLKQMYHNYSLAALRVLFSREEIAGLEFEGKENFDEDLTTFLKKVSEGREKMGIVVRVIDGNPHFVHQSFAEFFAASWLAANFRKNRTCIEQILLNPDYKLTSDMLNRTWAENHPLHVAVFSRDLHSTQRLLEARSKSGVNALDAGGRTPLHLAVLSGTDSHPDCITIVKSLVEDYKARLDVADEVLGWVPLRYAESVRAWTALHILLENGGHKLMKTYVGWPQLDPGSMLDAARRASVAVVRYLHKDRSGEFGYQGPNGETMIHVAVEGGNVEVLKYLIDEGRSVFYLLERGLNLEAVNNQGLTALKVAAQNGAYEAMAVLLESKASFQVDTSAKDSGGQLNACLLCAAFAGSLKSVQRLVENGALSDHRDNKGHTATWVAWHRGHFEVMDWLLTRGHDGDTPLTGASRLGELEMVASILSRGANIEGEGWLGQTPLVAAAQGGHLAIVELFLKEGANVSGRDNHGLSPLHHASSMGHEQVVALLLRYIKDVNIDVDNAGRTALDLATIERHSDVVTLLKAAGGRCER